MSLRDAMLRGRIVGRSVQRAERSLTGHAALELPLHLPVLRCSSGSTQPPAASHTTNSRIERGFIYLFMKQILHCKKVEALNRSVPILSC